MYRVINRKKGFIILPNKKVVGPQKSTTVDSIDRELIEMQRAKIITIHLISKKDSGWTTFCVDPLCVNNYDGSPDLVPIENGENGSLALSFRQSRDTELCFEIELPPRYVTGSDLMPELSWSLSDCGNYGNVKWVLEFNAANNWIIFKKDSLTKNISVPLELGNVDLSLPKIPGGGFKYNTLIRGKLIRKGSEDTYNLPVVISNFNISYQVERPKSPTTWKSIYDR